MKRIRCWLLGHDPRVTGRLTVEGQLVELHTCARCGRPCA